ncbi:hypothetical protein HOLleu_09798 [Holothuria leucospilota]|uniref:C2H2-type domain-containing protein n=1 Tax=Holothuria leucospilota TaxID=206669 RepID=A0A9Q1HE51_HOLLE|nr:hypothetical protein HOLleu_09798 [Holothuria leucospilota]
MKVVVLEGRPHLCLFALIGIIIPSDRELRFDYGVDSLPWKQKNPVKRPNSGILHSISFAGLQKRPRLNSEGLNETISDEGSLDMSPTSDAAEVSPPAFSDPTNQNHGGDTSGSVTEECSTPDNTITDEGSLDMSPTSDAVEVSPPAFSDPTNQNHGDDASGTTADEEYSTPDNIDSVPAITDEGSLDMSPTSDAVEVSPPAFSDPTNQNHGEDTSGSVTEECSTPDSICSLKSAINLIETADMSLTSQAVAVVAPIIMTTNRNYGSDSISDRIISDCEQHHDEIVPESDVESDDGRLIKVVRNVAKSDCRDETSAALSPAVSDESDNEESDNDISASTTNKQGNVEEKQDTPIAEVDCQPSTSQRPQSKRPLSKHDRPKRYCPFCSKGFCQGRLKRHILQVHKNIKDVQDALQLDKKEQTLKFSSLRKEGIFLINEKRMSENSCLEKERQQGDHTLVIVATAKVFMPKSILQSINKSAVHSKTLIAVPCLLNCLINLKNIQSSLLKC